MRSAYKTRLRFTWHAAVHLIGVGMLLVQVHILHVVHPLSHPLVQLHILHVSHPHILHVVHLLSHPLVHVCLKPLHLVRIRLLLLLLLLLLLVVVVLLL